MTGKSWTVLALIIIILGAVAYVVYTNDTKRVPAGPVTYQWEFSDRGEKDGIPQTRVTLVAGVKSYDLGTYEGSCAEQGTDYLENEKSKVVCWWAGGGHEIGVFDELAELRVKVGDVDEGASGIEGFRGNFKTIQTI